MTLRLNIKMKMTCPRHPRFDPEKHGEAGIRGGCARCHRMLQMFTAAGQFIDAAEKLAQELRGAAFLGDGA